PEGRHLRRARRRAGQREVLLQDWAELRELLALPRTDRPPGGGAGGVGGAEEKVVHVYSSVWRQSEGDDPFGLPLNGIETYSFSASRSLIFWRMISWPLTLSQFSSPSHR